MIIILEPHDYIKAVTPFRNGCSFKARFMKDGSVRIGMGCYCLFNLLQGAGRELYARWLDNDRKPVPVDIDQETQMAIKELPPCTFCGGSLFEE